MARKKSKDFRSIVSVNPVSLVSYEYFKNQLKIIKPEKTRKSSFIVSCIQSKNMIASVIDISKNIPDSDLKDAIEIKTYDELGLDSAIDFSITYMEIDSVDQKNRSFNVFVIDTSLINSELSKVKKYSSYIDYATTTPFLLKSLYQKSLIDSTGIDCFVYFQKEDAFLAIYRNGEYLYSKSLHYSLTEILENLSKLSGENINDKDFATILTEGGLKGNNLDYQQHLMKLFGEIFLYINDVIIYAKRTYSIEGINKIYIGSEIGEFIGVEEYAQSYLALPSYNFNFNIAKNSKEWYIDQIHVLMILTAEAYLENKNDELNFSPFKRPPAFSKRPIGKLFGILVASIILSLAYPSYQFGYSMYLQQKIDKKQKIYKDIYDKTTIIRNTLASLKKEKEKINSLLNKKAKKLDFRKKLLTKIYSKKVSYPMKAKLLSELFVISNRYKSKIKSLSSEKNEFLFNIQNRSDKKITEFIKNLTVLGKYNINTDKIERDEKKHRYFSKISIRINK